jgi:type IV pilus assembly protein PilB
MSVEDNRDTQQLIQRLLERAGYEVMLAENGLRGLEMLVVEDKKPDLILLDIMMPEMNGYEFSAKLQENEALSYIPVVFLTALGEEQDKARAFAVGAVDYLTKPIMKDRLLNAVQRHLQTTARWQQFQAEQKRIRPVDFIRFKQFLFDEVKLTFEKRNEFADVPSQHIYSIAPDLGISMSRLAEYIANFLTLPYNSSIDAKLVQLGILPAPFCRKNSVVAIKTANAEKMSFVLSNPFNLELVDHLNTFAGQDQFIITEPSNISNLFVASLSSAVKSLAGGGTVVSAPAMAGMRPTTMSDLEAELKKRFDQQSLPTTFDDSSTEESEPLILFVNQLIEAAYTMGASDIHIEPWEHEVIVRYRVDGDLRVVNRFGPHRLILPLVARIKIMSNLDIAEKRMPQDGRISFKKYTRKNLDFDLRVAVSPMYYGEKVVLRILDKTRSALPLSKLGFSARNLQVYRQKILQPYGMILHVGPTGSGKSMSLYSALGEIHRPEINIQTAEDPIEYTLTGINQMQMNRDIGLTFQRALRSYLRQDPDVLLVGEIRDLETAQIAVEAALTGHLLLSTLHTNDAPTAVTRLVEMGIEPFLVSSTIILVCSQRLLRRLCVDCKEPYEPNEAEKTLIGLPSHMNTMIYRKSNNGCTNCNGLGYKGRIGTHEILVPNEEMRFLISQKEGVTTERIKKMGVQNCGMTTLYWDSMEKVRQGIDSIEDVLAKIRADDFDSRPAWMYDESQLIPASTQPVS